MGGTQSIENEAQDHWKPLHYHPLKSYYECSIIPIFEDLELDDDSGLDIPLWKLNLLCISPDASLIFLAQKHEILVYSMTKVDKTGKNTDFKVPMRRINVENGDVDINQIKVGILNGTRPILISVDDVGEVRVFFVDNLDQKPVNFNNNAVSTWGCAVNTQAPMIAVSANSWSISIWNLANSSQEEYQKTTCEGHNHNIPCIDFSPCGNFIASVSIDCQIKIWEVETGTCIATKRLGTEWGWGCKWIQSDTIKNLAPPMDMYREVKEKLGQYFPTTELNEDDEDEFEGEEETFDDEDDDELAADFSPVHEDDEEPPLENAEIKNHKSSKEEVQNEQEVSEERTLIDEIGQPTMKKLKKNSKPDAFILCSTFHHLILLDSSMKVLATLANGIPSPIIPVPAFMQHMARISLLEYIPELSLAVAGSQGCSSVLLVKILRNVTTGKYDLLPESLLPVRPTPSPIVGMTISRHLSSVPELRYFRLYILLQNRKFFCYEIRRKGGNPLDISEKVL